MIYDAHAHLNYFKEKELLKILKNAKKEKVKIIISNSTTVKDAKEVIKLTEKHKIIKPALGLYPDKNLSASDFPKIKKLILSFSPIAIGEIGLDFSHEKPKKELQIKIFKLQLDLAQKLNLPAIIHTRKAEKEVIEIISIYPKLTKVLHCFCGKKKLAVEATKQNCYFSIPTSIVRSEQFQELVKLIPKNKILTETDSPYQSPIRGEQNEPANIKHSIKTISKIWNLTKKETENQIEKNFKRVFTHAN